MGTILFSPGPKLGSLRTSSDPTGSHFVMACSYLAIRGRKTFCRYSFTSCLSCPSMYTPFFSLVFLQPNFTSHRATVRTDSPFLRSNPRVGRMCSLSARWNFDGVTSPVARLLGKPVMLTGLAHC